MQVFLGRERVRAVAKIFLFLVPTAIQRISWAVSIVRVMADKCSDELRFIIYKKLSHDVGALVRLCARAQRGLKSRRGDGELTKPHLRASS